MGDREHDRDVYKALPTSNNKSGGNGHKRSLGLGFRLLNKA